MDNCLVLTANSNNETDRNALTSRFEGW